MTTMTASASIDGVNTPDIINITVSRTRGQMVGTAQGSFHSKSANTGLGEISISMMGLQVFTGTIKRIDTSPTFRCANEFIVRFSAEDKMHRLQGRTYTRRQKIDGLAVIAFITGHYKRINIGFDSPASVHAMQQSNSPVEFLSPNGNIAEWTSLLKNGETNTLGSSHPQTRLGDELREISAGGLQVHDHSSLEQLGPSVAVFGTK